MLRSLVFPVRCPLCGSRGAAPCAPCAVGLPPPPRPAAVPGCDTVATCFAYAGPARAMLLGLKYRNRRDALGSCAVAVARIAPVVDVVTWAPTVPRRARERGFDQAELLARAVAGQLGVPARRLLRRDGAAAQTGRSAAARRTGPRFRAVVGRPPGRVLLVDDIGTTGATLAGAAAALRAAGATEVHARTVAWTPPRARTGRRQDLGPQSGTALYEKLASREPHPQGGSAHADRDQ